MSRRGTGFDLWEARTPILPPKWNGGYPSQVGISVVLVLYVLVKAQTDVNPASPATEECRAVLQFPKRFDCLLKQPNKRGSPEV